MKTKTKRLFFLLFVSLFIINACSISDGVEKTSLLSLIKTTDPPPVTAKNDPNDENTVRKIKEAVLSNEKIYDAAVIKGKSDVLVAYKIKHLYRFRMKKIEGEMKKQLEDEFEDVKFTISSDFKIFLEAVKLQKKFERENLSEVEIDRELKKIIKLSKEQT